MSSSNNCCSVCGESGPKVHCHYGAQTCMGCKAFFRRCVRDEKSFDKKPCRGSDNNDNGRQLCQIDSQKRNQCRKCRLAKCFQVGMDPSLVLQSEDERMKFTGIRKRKRQQNQPETGNVNEQLPSMSAALETEPDSEQEQQQERPPVASSSRRQRRERDQHYLPRVQSTLTSICDSVMKTYTLSCASVNIKPEVMQEVINFHLNPDMNPMSRGCLDSLFRTTLDQIKSFANRSMAFFCISESEKKILLKKNGHLIWHYYLAKYLTSTSGLDQITWLLGFHTPTLSLDVVDHLQLVPFARFNKSVQMFKADSTYEMLVYIDCCYMIGQHFVYPAFYNGLLLNTLLFNLETFTLDEKERLENSEEIARMSTTSVELLMHGCKDSPVKNELGVENINQLISTLAKMERLLTSKHFEANVGMSRAFVNSRLTSDEEAWLNRQLLSFDDAFASVQVGSELQNLLMAMRQGDKSKMMIFAESMARIGTHRFEAVMSAHPEMKSVSSKDKWKIITKSTVLLRTLLYTRVEFRPLERGMPKQGESWRLDNDNISKVLTGFVKGNMQRVLAAEDAETFYRLEAEVRRWVEDPAVVKLLILILVLDAPDHYVEVKRLQQSYEVALVKRLAIASHLDLDSTPSGEANKLLANLWKALKTMLSMTMPVHQDWSKCKNI